MLELEYTAAIMNYTVTVWLICNKKNIFKVTVQCFKFSNLNLHLGTDTFWNRLFFVKGDRNLKLKLAVLLTSQWYYLITPLAAKQYYTTEEPGQELHILHTHSRRSAGECLSSQWNTAVEHTNQKSLSCLEISVKIYRLKEKANYTFTRLQMKTVDSLIFDYNTG